MSLKYWKSKIQRIAKRELDEIYELLDKGLLTPQEAHEAIKELRRAVSFFMPP